MRIAALLVLSALIPASARAFSQSSPVTPIGHEFLTAASALEMLGEHPNANELAACEGKKVAGADHEKAPSKALADVLADYQKHGPALDAPAKTLLTGVPGKINGKSYGAKHYAIWSAVMGQRWVDIGGFVVLPGAGQKCWDAITQAQDHVQYSHFLRRPADSGGEGAVRAVKAAQQRLRSSFVQAVLAPMGDLSFWDGGAESKKHTASRPFFYFGRAVHLFQDSFSPEHGVRDPSDGYRSITGIKSYVCTPSSLLHTHAAPTSATHGDVIWKKVASGDWSDHNIKPIALASKRAMKDLWAAFLKARLAPEASRRKVAEEGIEAVIAQWMSYDEKTLKANAHTTPAAELAKCKFEEAAIEKTRLSCVKTIGVSSEQKDFDEDLQIPFEWAHVPQ